MLTFLSFTWEFSLLELSVSSNAHWNSQKSIYYWLVITLWKCEYCLIRALNKSILFGSNSLKLVSYELWKTFYYSSVCKEPYENVSIAWYKLWKTNPFYLDPPPKKKNFYDLTTPLKYTLVQKTEDSFFKKTKDFISSNEIRTHLNVEIWIYSCKIKGD